MKFLKMSVLCLALLGVLVPPPALAIAAIPPWYVMCEVSWTVPAGTSATIRAQPIQVEFAVWTAIGPVFGVSSAAKVGDGYAYSWVTVVNGSHYGDLYATVAECPFTQVRSEPAPGTAKVWVEGEYGVVWNSGFVNWHSLVID